MDSASGVPLSTCYGHRNAKTYNEVRKRGKETILGRKVTTRYFQGLRHDTMIYVFCIINPIGWQMVWTEAPDGTRQYWQHTWENGVMVFHAPDGYYGGPGELGAIMYAHSHETVADAMVFESQKVWSFGECSPQS